MMVDDKDGDPSTRQPTSVKEGESVMVVVMVATKTDGTSEAAE